MQFMFDEKKTSILDMAPKRPETIAGMVIAKCVRNRQLNALFPFYRAACNADAV